MKKSIKLLFVLLFIFKLGSAQSDTLICDAPDQDSLEFASLPYFANNAYLQTFLDSIGYPSAGSRIIPTSQVRYHVPIKFWVYRSSAGIGGPDIRDLRNYINNLNRFFNVDNRTWIGFYMKCEIGFVDDDSHLVINNGLEGVTMECEYSSYII